jgi:hypothetical protein
MDRRRILQLATTKPEDSPTKTAIVADGSAQLFRT